MGERIYIQYTTGRGNVFTWVWMEIFDGPLNTYEGQEHIKIIREPLWDENSREIL